MTEPESPLPKSKLRAYAELVRLPNVFTAMADVLMGFMITSTDTEVITLGGMTDATLRVGLLIAASSCLYMAGMVLNDVFDYPDDLLERPRRPLPSGRIGLATARRLGFLLLAAGVLLGTVVTIIDWRGTSAVVAFLLAAAVLLYDGWLKRSPLGPVAMGSCRFLNVLLGASGGTLPWTGAHWLVALGIGIYIAGVTWFARDEAFHSKRLRLAAAALVMLGGLVLLAYVPRWASTRTMMIGDQPIQILLDDFRFAQERGWTWYALWAMFGVSIGYRAAWAVAHPVPIRVQMAVKHAILSLIVIDAALAFGAHGISAAIPILLLIAPTFVLGQQLYST